MFRNKIKMTIIGKDESKQLVTRSSDSIDYSPFITGKGKLDFICGKCNLILVKKTDEEEINGLTFRCPSCLVYNVHERKLDLNE